MVELFTVTALIAKFLLAGFICLVFAGIFVACFVVLIVGLYMGIVWTGVSEGKRDGGNSNT